jgi:hypothetical protein
MMDFGDMIKKLVTQGVESLTQEEKETLRNIGHQKDGVKEFLSKISIEEIVKKSETFRGLNVKKMSDEDLFNALMEAISFDVDGNGTKMSFLMPRGITYSVGTRFYKIRPLAKGDDHVPLKTMSIEQDAWNAPKDKCTLGRLNKDGESLLYTSAQSPNACVEEIAKNGRYPPTQNGDIRSLF